MIVWNASITYNLVTYPLQQYCLVDLMNGQPFTGDKRTLL